MFMVNYLKNITTCQHRLAAPAGRLVSCAGFLGKTDSRAASPGRLGRNLKPEINQIVIHWPTGGRFR